MTEQLPARRPELTPAEVGLLIDVLERRTEAMAAARAAVGYVADDEDWPTTKFYRRLQGKFRNMLPKKSGRRASVMIEIALNIIARKKSEGGEVQVLPTCRRLALLLWRGLDAKSLEKKAKSLESAFHKRERKKIKGRK